MSQLRLRHLASSDEVRQSAAAWDELWLQSDVASPASRAEMVALRVDYLSARTPFRALVVELDGRMVAALPLVNRRLKGLLNVGSLPCDCWVAGGALLLDPAADSAAALDCLVSAIPQLPWPLLWLDQVSFDDPTWMAFRAAAARAGLSVSVREHYQMGQLPMSENWQSFLNAMKGDHRRKINRLVRKLDEAGGAELKVYRAMPREQVDELVERGFEVEDRSWKGTEGTSVIRNQAVFDQYLAEARLLARLGNLELVFLEHGGQPIAFMYGWMAKGVHFMTKIGYDESYAKFAPGQQLTLRLLERLHAEPHQRMIDTAGPLKDFHKVWNARSYPVGPLVVATPRLVSRSLFHVYSRWQPYARRAGQRAASTLRSARIQLGAAARKIAETLSLARQPQPPDASNAEPEA